MNYHYRSSAVVSRSHFSVLFPTLIRSLITFTNSSALALRCTYSHVPNIFTTRRDVIFITCQYIDWIVPAKGVGLCGFTEPEAVYEIQLLAFNGNGGSIGNKRLVSLAEGGTGDKNDAGELHYTHSIISLS